MGNWLKKLKENVIRAQLALEIPLARRRGIAAAHSRLPECLKYFLKKKVFLRDGGAAPPAAGDGETPRGSGGAEAQPKRSPKSGGKRIDDLSALSMGWIYDDREK